MPYIPFTEEQKLRANSVDLVGFLRRQGEKLIPSGRDKRLASDHSITVRGNEWYDHASKEGGGAISFVQPYYGLPYQEAVKRLLDGEGIAYPQAKTPEPEERKEFALPPANRTMRRLYAYLLQQRFIGRDILDAFTKRGMIYESCEKSRDGTKEYHNAVFVGSDEYGAARHAHKRGLYTQGRSFRGNVEGSDPRCSFHWFGHSGRLYVFEAPIDLLAFLTLNPEAWKEHSYVALCGTSEQAMLWMLEKDPGLQKVVLCLDHDAAGIEASGRLTDILTSLFTTDDYLIDFDTLDGERFVLVAAAGLDLPELYLWQGGALQRATHFNDQVSAQWHLSVPEPFTFLDRDGVEIDGWVLYPADFDKNRKYPGILDVHGGPQTAYGEGFFHEMQYWAGLGYIVFFCNPRGSSGKGGGFADIYGDNYGVRDYNDLMEFTDQVLERVPQIDPSRIGMTGGSYGGFMANWIIGHTDRFAAVASQRSIANYISKCLTTDIGYYHNLSAIQADPWTSPEKMWAHSPLAYANRAKTPTLFIQSDEDYRCWMGDAVQMLQALLMHGVPARMCLFHGENHELSRSGKPKHRVRRLREITQWFDQYLKRCE